MNIFLAPELEAKLNRVASQLGQAPDQLIQELVANYVAHDEWFRQEVGKGIASLGEGKSIPHQDVRRRVEQFLQSK
jgi:predicted transcriptional regulator